MDNLAKQLLSFAVGLGLAFILAFTVTYPLGIWIGTELGLSGILRQTGAVLISLVPCSFFFFSGIRRLGPSGGKEAIENGLPTLFGSYFKWWIMPSGDSWWLPTWLGGGYTAFDMRTRGGAREDEITMTDVTTRDNFEVGLHTFWPWRIKSVWEYAHVDNPETLVYAIMDQAGRHVVSVMWALHVPHRLGELSRALKGDKSLYRLDDPAQDGIEITRNPEDVERYNMGEDVPTMRIALSPDYNPAKRLAEIGIEIVDPSVRDVDLPSELVQANERRRIEEAQREAQMTQAGTYNAVARRITDGFAVDPNLAVSLAAAADGKAQVIHVSGGSAIERAAAIHGRPNRQGGNE